MNYYTFSQDDLCKNNGINSSRCVIQEIGVQCKKKLKTQVTQ